MMPLREVKSPHAIVNDAIADNKFTIADIKFCTADIKFKVHFAQLDVSDFVAIWFLTPLIKRRYNPNNRFSLLTHFWDVFLGRLRPTKIFSLAWHRKPRLKLTRNEKILIYCTRFLYHRAIH